MRERKKQKGAENELHRLEMDHQLRVSTCVYVCVPSCMCLYVPACVCACMHACIHAYECVCYLKHGVCEKGFQHASFPGSVGLILLKQLIKVSVLLAVGQNLQTVLVVTDKLLVDVQHGEQDVKQIRWEWEGHIKENTYVYAFIHSE